MQLKRAETGLKNNQKTLLILDYTSICLIEGLLETLAQLLFYKALAPGGLPRLEGEKKEDLPLCLHSRTPPPRPQEKEK